jgi:phosphoribosyl 1,2-cyclic phosphodiesterase
MVLRFTVLASGSAGNTSFLEVDGFGLLLDFGLGPRQLARRLAGAEASWSQIRMVLLTHTHSDHWNERTLLYLRRLRIPLVCHTDHHAALLAYSPAFEGLLADDLVQTYEPDVNLPLAPGLCCRPFRLCHDCGLTCGFRFERTSELFGEACALAYAADLGSWTADLADVLSDVDLLALEFNHDVAMEQCSGRSPRLIARVLGDHGHLSNVQAAALLREVLQRSAPGRLRQVVQLHLSRECNHPTLAARAAAGVLHDHPGIDVHTACQHQPSPTFHLRGPTKGIVRRPRSTGRKKRTPSGRPWLPGMEHD